tara:strand:- start:594 stop:815 length:222 start_codon:yes stop_codon:yes gene_type:complete
MKKIEVMILNVIFSISITEDCGAGRDRTDDLLNAIQALSQLSYGPIYNLSMDNNSENKTYIQILLLFIGIKIN